MANCKIISLNCHGFNIGTARYLRRICSNTDIILLQETWLSDINSSRITDEFSDFVLYHNSAMEDRMTSSIRRGRPFGGTAVLVHKRLNKSCHKLCTYNAGVCAVECQLNGYSLVLGSVYMPCDDGSQEHTDEFEAVVGVLQCLLDRGAGSKFIFGGDFNVEKHNKNLTSQLVHNFCDTNSLQWLDHHMTAILDSDVLVFTDDRWYSRFDMLILTVIHILIMDIRSFVL